MIFTGCIERFYEVKAESEEEARALILEFALKDIQEDRITVWETDPDEEDWIGEVRKF
jgi:hypothetical protein